MSSSFAQRLSGWLIVILLLGLSGCGRKSAYRAYQVKGVLTMDGQPFGPILLVLQSTQEKGPVIRGEADDKGNLKFTTNRLGDGVPAGEYRVYFPKDPFGRETKKVPDVYQDFRVSPLTVKIESKRNDLNIELDSKADLPSSDFADPTLGPAKKKRDNKGNRGPKPKEKTETEKPRPSQLDPTLVR